MTTPNKKTVTASHVKLHAYGNWGVNVEGENVDSFTRRNGVSLVTLAPHPTVRDAAYARPHSS